MREYNERKTKVFAREIVNLGHSALENFPVRDKGDKAFEFFELLTQQLDLLHKSKCNGALSSILGHAKKLYLTDEISDQEILSEKANIKGILEAVLCGPNWRDDLESEK